MTIEITSRYGTNLPDPDTMCSGECEGTGYVPVMKNDLEYQLDWEMAEKENPSDDGYHFVKCHDCKGSGKNVGA